ncbi:hypothetical protein LMG27952_04767 [Paraburkholderia hiiakae]|uniref:Zinc-ribbon domain-containing protein n=1 Tax=Paraburkholderia hiiakae TaxID=1081782 RepID=A0ABN7I546_9BURK|nr:zinc-ribbon domain-containing protein [Paraburkholderia hiiakae]CAD6548674.1 hypothetical protein LMG27952_04767 [Paraburkholderia hiiakae]
MARRRKPYRKPRHYPTLAAANPDFLPEWDWKLNGDILPSDLTLGSDRRVWWRCGKNALHCWQASPSNRHYGGTGCPYCAGRRIDGTNCLATTHPSLAAQWHPTKNGTLVPTDVPPGTHRRVYWRCPMGHDWRAAVYSRVSGKGCPYCSGRAVLPENSLAARRPDLLSDWHPVKNGSLNPASLSLGSDVKPWWLCKFGHEWAARIDHRVRLGSGCPKCTRQTSTPELRLFCELRTIFPDICHRASVGARLEVDLLIPSLKLVVQYDGKRFHSPKVERDRRNTAALETLGFRVVRIRDRSLPHIGVTLPINERLDLSVEDIKRLVALLPSVVPVRKYVRIIRQYLARDRFAEDEAYLGLCASLPGPLPGKSLKDRYPDIAARWHVEKNGRLSPSDVTAKSGMKVYWRCDRHGAYFGTVRDRVLGKGCMYCRRYVVLAEDSLAQLHPELASEFHSTRNGDRLPTQIAPGSNKKVWWRCRRNERHEWEAVVNSRVGGNGCPICSNKKIVRANCLARLEPRLAKQWHYERNSPLRPEDVGRGSHKVVWWRCPVDPGHEWAASVANRTRLRVGCPYCGGRKTDPKRSLAAVRPDLAGEWHPELNDRGVEAVLPGSGQKVWWQCRADPTHVWQARVELCNTGYGGCPTCRQRARAASKEA